MKRRLFTSILAIMMAVCLAVPSYAATYSSAWVKDASNIWHVKGADGAYLKGKWFCDDAIAENGKNIWYLLDTNGNMVIAGLVQDGTGNFYSIETNPTGYYGMLRYKKLMFQSPR